ncbi:MAG: PTS sugar transporter subunit IIA [Spirochaetales bacterium]|nr:PTS sugar transporter subunit IIA [Spirochaetales bacterium]
MVERDCLKSGSVKCLKSHEKIGAIKELLYGTSLFKQVKNVKKLEKAILERERIQSTGLGNGIAFAHGRTDAVKAPLIALGVSREGIQYDAVDGKPVRFLFLIADPPGMNREYLRLLSVMAILCHNEKWMDEILAADSQGKIERRFFDEFNNLVGHPVPEPAF